MSISTDMSGTTTPVLVKIMFSALLIKYNANKM